MSPLDLLATVADAKGNDTTISYDSLGRKTAMRDPDMGSWAYASDANGNLVRQTDAKGQRLCFYYDALDRLTGTHQRTSMSANGLSTAWTYDARGRVDTATHTVSGLAGNRIFDVGYDSADRVVTHHHTPRFCLRRGAPTAVMPIGCAPMSGLPPSRLRAFVSSWYSSLRLDVHVKGLAISAPPFRLRPRRAINKSSLCSAPLSGRCYRIMLHCPPLARCGPALRRPPAQ